MQFPIIIRIVRLVVQVNDLVGKGILVNNIISSDIISVVLHHKNDLE